MLLNQLFRLSQESKDGASVSSPECRANEVTNEDNNNLLSLSQKTKCSNNSTNLNESVQQQDEWKLCLLVDKVIKTRSDEMINKQSQSTDKPFLTEQELHLWTICMFTNIRSECSKSNIKQFTSQILFVDQIIRHLNNRL